MLSVVGPSCCEPRPRRGDRSTSLRSGHPRHAHGLLVLPPERLELPLSRVDLIEQIALVQSSVLNGSPVPAGDATYGANFAQEADGWSRETRDERRIFRVPARGPLVTHDATSVTANGTFMHETEWTGHEIELRFECRTG
jgi:hypothetical protein